MTQEQHDIADARRRLLVALGYAESPGIFQHDTRKAIFVSDFVDRRPEGTRAMATARTEFFG
jgi:hypothetical protein